MLEWLQKLLTPIVRISQGGSPYVARTPTKDDIPATISTHVVNLAAPNNGTIYKTPWFRPGSNDWVIYSFAATKASGTGYAWLEIGNDTDYSAVNMMSQSVPDPTTIMSTPSNPIYFPHPIGRGESVRFVVEHAILGGTTYKLTLRYGMVN